jgi:hypothetical protein
VETVGGHIFFSQEKEGVHKILDSYEGGEGICCFSSINCFIYMPSHNLFELY